MDDFGDFLWFLFGGLTFAVGYGLWRLVTTTTRDDQQRRKQAEAEVLELQPGESAEDE